MKGIFKTVWIILCIALISIYILSSLSTFIPPAAFSYISLFSLAFPYILAAFLVSCIISFFVEKKLAYIMLIILPIGYFNTVNTFAFGTKIAWQSKKEATTLRIMTWNVEGFVNNLRKKSKSAYRTTKEEMLATIHNYDPDIICLQEYTNIENAKRRESVRKQLDSLGYNYFFCSEDRVKIHPKNHVVVENGVAIYSKFPLLDSARITINPSDNENLIYADVLLNNKPVRIFTAHLQSFTIYTDTAGEKNEGNNIYEITYERRRAVRYKIRETEIKHQEEISIIRKAIDQSPNPVIYCGDINTTPTSYNYRYLKGNNLQDVFLAKGSGIGNTFYAIGRTLRIDVCLADKVMQVQQCKRDKKKLSDHYPVITDVSWKINK